MYQFSEIMNDEAQNEQNVLKTGMSLEPK